MCNVFNVQVCEMYGQLGSWEEALTWQKEQEQFNVSMDAHLMEHVR